MAPRPTHSRDKDKDDSKPHNPPAPPHQPSALPSPSLPLPQTPQQLNQQQQQLQQQQQQQQQQPSQQLSHGTPKNPATEKRKRAIAAALASAVPSSVVSPSTAAAVSAHPHGAPPAAGVSASRQPSPRLNSLYKIVHGALRDTDSMSSPPGHGQQISSQVSATGGGSTSGPRVRGGSGGSGSVSSGSHGSQVAAYKHVTEIFMCLKDYMNKCDLTSYGPKAAPVPNAWTNLITNDRKTFSLFANKLLSEMKNVFKNEERMVNVASPLYVFGDIHGNLHDLRYYERELWANGPSKVRVSFVFLGDLVDRGHHSLEVILYLFCCKLLSRKNAFVLIRGNHELRAIQQAFTFHRECIEKLGPQLGVQIWTNINKCFDNMPLAALIDQHIFCCHGGIPMSTQNIRDINKIETPLNDPENQSPLAWELMWNDPLTNTVFGEMAELLRLQSGTRAFSALKGFLPNNKRGTAYYFSETAALKFMEANGLSHVIRAHECLPTGYTLHSNQKLITVFSSSKYCGGNNDAACVLVEYDDVRVIRLDIGEHNAIPGPNSREVSTAG